MSIEELRAAKRALGLQTDRELADFLGVKASSINNYRERGIPQKMKAKIYQKELVTSKENNLLVHYYPNVTASAGYGIANYEAQAQNLELSESLLLGVKIQNKNNLDILCVRGDSMLPMLKDGDRVLVERECATKNGDVIIANIDGDIYVKRIQKDPNKKWITLVSDNPEYGIIKLEGQEIEKLRIIAVVRATFRVKIY